MPLHLLGKKSWNVYNVDNIERVRRDEAAAAATQEAEEQRLQEIDSDRRIQILRGASAEHLRHDDNATTRPFRNEDLGLSISPSGKRRLKGEDDTDRDMRLARERHNGQTRTDPMLKSSNAPLFDSRGHVALFPDHLRASPAEDTVLDRDHRVTGKTHHDLQSKHEKGRSESLKVDPWYSKENSSSAQLESTLDRDVWGNKDSRRRDRHAQRLTNDDPLAVMRRGVKKVKQTRMARSKWKKEKQREIAQLDAAEILPSHKSHDRRAASETHTRKVSHSIDKSRRR